MQLRVAAKPDLTLQHRHCVDVPAAALASAGQSVWGRGGAARGK